MTQPFIHQLFIDIIAVCRKLGWYNGGLTASQFRTEFNFHMGCDIPNVILLSECAQKMRDVLISKGLMK